MTGPGEATTGAPTSTRPVWIIAGSVLWLLVGVMAFVAIRSRRPVPAVNPLDERDVPLVIQTPTGNPDGNGAGAAPLVAVPAVESAAVHPWDLAGIEDFELTERSGRRVTKADLLGRPWVVCFIFTKCAGPCKDITAQMSRLQEALKETDVRLVTLSVDPDYDTPAILEREADAFGADPDRWLFLTGQKAGIYRLIQGSFRMPVRELTGPDRKPGWEVLHSTNLLLVDERGVVQAKYDGTKPDQVAQLVARLTGPAIAEIPGDPPTDEPPAEGRP